jgi:hypothetical protein
MSNPTIIISIAAFLVVAVIVGLAICLLPTLGNIRVNLGKWAGLELKPDEKGFIFLKHIVLRKNAMINASADARVRGSHILMEDGAQINAGIDPASEPYARKTPGKK